MKIFTLLLLVTFGLMRSQDFADEPYTPRSSFGLFGGVGLNFHTADFQSLPGVDGCCSGYDVGGGLGYNFGLFYAVPISTSFDLDFRLIYAEMGATLSKTDERLIPNQDFTGTATAEIENKIISSLSTFGLEPMLSWKLTDQIRVKGGIRAAFLMSNNAEQSESVVSPSFGVIIDKNGNERRSVNVYNGEIQDLGNLDLSLSAAISYDLPLNKNHTWFLVPEARYSLGLLSYHPDNLWQSNQLTGGIGIRYAPRKMKEVAPPPPPPTA